MTNLDISISHVSHLPSIVYSDRPVVTTESLANLYGTESDYIRKTLTVIQVGLFLENTFSYLKALSLESLSTACL